MICQLDVIDLIRMSLLLLLNSFDTLFRCFYCYLWINKMPVWINRQNAFFQLISQNQEAFIGLLNEPEDAGEEGTEGGVASGGNVQAAPGGGIQIQVTPDEKAQIDKV